MTSCTVLAPVRLTAKLPPLAAVMVKSFPPPVAVPTPLPLLSWLSGVAGVMLRRPRSAAVAPPFSLMVMLVPCIKLSTSTPVPSALIRAWTLTPAPLMALSKS